MSRFIRALRRPLDQQAGLGGETGQEQGDDGHHGSTTAHAEVGRYGLPPALADRQRGLLLAEAVVERAAGNRSSVRHIAVIGPTQTGKSSVVNALLGTTVAEVSPLAGFTVHPQAFWISEAPIPVEADRWLPGLREVPRDELARDDFQSFSVQHVSSQAAARELQGCVIWDTPDFDSVAAQAYQRGLLEVLALADVHVLVLSKEKYADLSAWKLLRLLNPLGRPLIICLNKLNAEAAEVVPAALRGRLAELDSRLVRTPVEVLPYVENAGDRGIKRSSDQGQSHCSHSSGTPAPRDADLARETPLVWAAAGLRSAIAEELKHAARQSHAERAAAARLMLANWQSWTAPLEAEHSARQAWRQAVRSACDDFLRSYRRDYLDDPKRYDSFRRATVELLQLLEIPVLSKALTQVRQTVSWPVRKLVGLGRNWVANRRGHVGRGGEEGLLQHATEALLLHVRRAATQLPRDRQSESPFWGALHQRLEQETPALREQFGAALQQHAVASAEEIHRTADELYRTLQKQPAALHTLRAARATADVGGILFAIKTGGVHINDLVLAPAMLALTTLFTEGALGSYMEHSAYSLKERLYARVQTELVEGVFAQRLEQLANELRSTEIIGVSPVELQQARALVVDWERAA